MEIQKLHNITQVMLIHRRLEELSSWNSIVSIMTGYRLDNLDSNPNKGRDFSLHPTSRPTMGPPIIL
jgi:hypothetical protein